MSNLFSFKATYTIVLILLYVFALGWFLNLYLTFQTEGLQNILSNLYGIIPLFGGLYGLWISRRWGGFKSAVGKAVIFLSLGLTTWGIGMAIWLYYNLILKVEIPYPSWADAAFIISWPLWGIGMVFLSKATGARFALRNLGGKLLLLFLPLLIILFSYYVLVVIARGGLLDLSGDLSKIFFDLAYPVGDVVILTLATLIYGLSFNYFGGKYRFAIYLILAGFILNYAADFSFSYTTTKDIYYNGSLSDILFATAMFILVLGVSMLDAGSISSGVEYQKI